MLRITVPSAELWDEAKQEFVHTHEQTLQLEHSLVSLSKWESKWHKAFLTKKDKSTEETLDYVRCMTITQNVDPTVYSFLSSENLDVINAYIENPMTATCFQDEKSGGINRETTTAELIYYWMIAFNIPFECQKWHLNRLLTLIRVCSIKNRSPKKRSKREIMQRNAELNAIRRQQMHTNG